MNMKPSMRQLAFVATLATLGLSACGNVSHGVAKDGAGANQLVWPDPGSVTPIHKGGTYPETAQLQLLRYGMNKQQIAMLIGYPHFDEGIWGVREWNYVFNFRESGSERITVCQFKILFDEAKTARSFYWNPQSCSRYMAVPVSSLASSSAAHAPEQQVNLLTDALFAFDRGSMEDVTPAGRVALNELAHDIVAQKGKIEGIHIRGYSDRLGGDAYDYALSKRRADAVMQYLVGHGVPENFVQAEGLGKSDAVKTCPSLPTKQLIKCLSPNRRVEVQIHLLSAN
jgi:OmpA-OmpF porin, OOP family